MNLKDLGWNQEFDDKLSQINLQEDFQIARVAIEYKGMYKLYTERGEVLAEITGKMRYNNQFPAVGDWVIIDFQNNEDRAIIHDILPRMSKFSRKAAGTNTNEQIVAANIDTVFIVTSLNQDFNLRRLERYLTIAWNSGAKPVIVLSKADLCDKPEIKKNEVETVAFGVPIHIISSLTGKGLNELKDYLIRGKTAALLGSSGVGKSTIINQLLDQKKMEVNEIRINDGRGKHTTTHRELIVLESGGILIDTPGMREVQLWDDSEGINESFEDLKSIAKKCKFNDCQHDTEPGCAVKKAIENGELTKERLENYRKLKRELLYVERKRKYGAEYANKLKYKELMGL
ncbi:ribosome biogenesis GTPase [Halanaerobium saccharolyticum]|uniref:Small ribosomal subunit biogenesis GTPase RsgA n=1 Tax=Halanaerobium saccharolyticum TaxID=43595 RepID=A0A4R6LBQ8_9FIRM|nr:ribosome small subunit-dependent GTPase A [Halanaerobium saccharolyticum]TDO73397.1 ribosome biogenesis GTPase [Halanaerobium saccharolyticum]